MQPRFEQFIRERQYLRKRHALPTVEWYRHQPQMAALRVARHKQRPERRRHPHARKVGGRRPAATVPLRAINAYLHWSQRGYGEVKCGPGVPASARAYSKSKSRTLVLPTFTASTDPAA